MGKQLRDLTGQIFERWTVIRFDRFIGKKPNRKAYWLCECECGTRKSVWMGSLTTGLSKSCGCFKIDNPGARTHGLSKTREYRIWAGMWQRCTNPKEINYERYGARGITVCERWRLFPNFLEDMGKAPFKNAQLDRIDNSLGYFKENCRWVTSQANNRNTRRTVRVTFNGETLSVPEWAERVGLTPELIHNRLRLHWPVEKLFTPADCRNSIRRNSFAKSTT